MAGCSPTSLCLKCLKLIFLGTSAAPVRSIPWMTTAWNRTEAVSTRIRHVRLWTRKNLLAQSSLGGHSPFACVQPGK